MKISSFTEGQINKTINDHSSNQSKGSATINEARRESGVVEKAVKRQENITREDLEEAVQAANEVVHALDRRLEFSIHEGTNRTMVKIVDPVEDKVIREIPPEKLLDLVAKMWEVVGLFVDEKV